jgi:signal transduction histidine kinase
MSEISDNTFLMRMIKFSDSTENEFKSDFNQRSIIILRFTLISILIAGVVPYSFLDILIVPLSLKFTWFIRYCIWAPVFSVSIFLTYRPFIKTHFQTIAIISNLTLSYGVLAMIFISRRSELGFTAYYSGLMVSLATLIMFRVRFKSTLIIIGSVAISYILVAILKQKMLITLPNQDYPSIFINNLVFLASIAVIVAVTSFMLENYSRFDFMMRRQLEKDKLRIQEKNEQIINQNKRIKQQNEEVKEFYTTKNKLFSIIAHDLKSPFNSLIGFSNLLIDSYKKENFEDIIKYGSIINEISKNSFALLNNLLDWSRIQTDSFKMIPEDIDLCDIISDNIKFISNISEPKSLSFSLDCPSNISVTADFIMINTVLRNLLSNAVKFSFAGNRIDVNVTDKFDRVEVEVIDYGVGIDSDNIDKLFSLETNYSSHGTEDETGTGLGLILCSSIIELHNGKIWVTSEPGKKTSFSFFLPRDTKDGVPKNNK